MPIRTTISLGIVFLLLVACRTESTDEMKLSQAAQFLIQDAFAPFEGDTLVDNHVHILGMGNSGSGIEINSDMQSVIHPFKLTRFSYFMDAGGITDDSRADEQYISQLLSQMAEFPIHLQILGLALDKHYLENGEVDRDETEIYIPNQYIVDLSQKYPEQFIPAISIHPYRKDAVLELEYWAARGVRVVKWVPNAQGINPDSKLCVPFYKTMRRLDMVLLSHAGTERAIDSQGRQHLGNPLLLRKALDAGVKVIVAHCAVAGESEDLDDPDGAKLANFELFLRLFDNPEYKGLLFADISAMTLLNQLGDPLKVILSRTDLHSRLLYGSDYPLPAVSILNNNSALSYLGYLDKEILPALEEIQKYNPLLYNFILMRSLRHPDSGARFSEELFRNRLP